MHDRIRRLAYRSLLAALGMGLAACSVEMGHVASDGSGMATQQQSPHTLEFRINKWLTADGTQRSPVLGRFEDVSVTVSQDVSTLLNLQDLAGVTAVASIELDSVNTESELRDTRIEETYFQVPSFLTASFAVSNLRPQASGPAGILVADGVLTIHGNAVSFPDIQLFAVRERDGWNVSTNEPLVIRHADIGLDPSPLIELCQHAGLDAEATVTAQFRL